MGLDIYAGTLTRYYSRDWKSMPQQLAEKGGQKFVMLDGSGNEIKPEENKKVIEEIREAVCQWIGNVAASVDSALPGPLWDEHGEHAYFTDRPDWEAYGALILLQACSLLGCPLPEYVESGWNVYDEPAVKEAMSRGFPCSLLSDVALWLPIPRKVAFVTTLPVGEEATLSTVAVLKQELEELNQKIWKADEATILSWRNDKYYIPVEEEEKESKSFFGFLHRRKKPAKEKYRTEELAQCAYSILYQAVDFADRQNLPIVLDC